MSWASKTYTFSPSTTVRSAEVNQNFTDVVNSIDIAMPSAASGHGIILFSGAIVDIPSGWYLCNGSNGTPDLRNKFVVGAGDTYAVNATGGEATHTLTSNEMPSHTHIQNAHTHTQNAHSHGAPGKSSAGSGAYFAAASSYTGDIGPTHSATATNQNTTATNQNTGGDAAHNNLPPYLALAYIMKS